MIKLQVPYYSQHFDVADKKWQGSACTVTNLKMVLDYYSNVRAPALPSASASFWRDGRGRNIGIIVPTIDELVREGVAIGGFGTRGWIHEAIVRLARNHGLHAYTQEFRSRNGEVERRLVGEGIKKIKNAVEIGQPVIVSVPGSRTRSKVRTHTVLLVGLNEKGFYYHNPDAKEGEEGSFQHISFKDFKDDWRTFAIFFEKGVSYAHKNEENPCC